MDGVVYKIAYFIVYSLIFIGEGVRLTLLWILKTIGYIVPLIVRLVFGCARKIFSLVKSSAKLIANIIKLPKLPHLYALKWFLLGTAFASLFIFLPLVLISWFNQLPNPRTLSYMKFPATTKFYDRNGKQLVWNQSSFDLVCDQRDMPFRKEESY